MKLKVLFAVLILASCKPEVKVNDSLLQHMPKNAALIVKVNDFSKFKSELKNNSFLSAVKTLDLFEDLFKKLEYVEFSEPQAQFAVAFYEIGKRDFEFLILTKHKLPEIALTAITNKTIEKFSYEDQAFTKYTLNGTPIFTMAKQPVNVTTSSQLLLENFIRSKQDVSIHNSLQKLQNAADTTSALNVYLNFEHADGLFKKYLKNKEAKGISEFADWMGFDFTADQNLFSLSGICLASDSTKNLVNLLKDDIPFASNLASITPQSTDALLSYALNDPNNFITRQNTYLDRAKSKDTLFTTIDEIGIAQINDQKAIVLNSFGAEALKEKLTPYTIGTTTYQNNEIFELDLPDLLETNLEPLVKDFDCKYYTILENSFVFGLQKEVLQNFIANTNNRTTFNKTTTHSSSKTAMAAEANMTFIANKNGIQHFLEEDFSAGLAGAFKKLDLEDYSFASQLVAEKDFLHANIIVSKNKGFVENNTVGPLFTVELDTDLTTDPQFVKNHRTGQQEIVVQDIDNFIYLISTKGKVLWKKQLNGKIRGKVHQVDLYKNGKLQLAFCTNNQFLVLDRNGKEVAPFNKTYESGNLNALAVFDYEKNRNYRFVVTQGRKIFMYNGQGQIVEGFVYKEAEHGIIAAPDHFRISGKDYLAFRLDNNTISFRHRAGQERIKVPTEIDFSDNGVFLYKNKFSLTDTKGVLHQIDTQGNLTKTNFNLGRDHGMYATSKTLVLMNENVLSIRGKKVELDLGVYTAPKIFYIYDKIYVGVTDIQNQQIYLYDSQAKPIANFPVYGTSMIDLIDMDGDKKLELVAKDQENSLIIYQIN